MGDVVSCCTQREVSHRQLGDLDPLAIAALERATRRRELAALARRNGGIVELYDGRIVGDVGTLLDHGLDDVPRSARAEWAARAALGLPAHARLDDPRIRDDSEGAGWAPTTSAERDDVCMFNASFNDDGDSDIRHDSRPTRPSLSLSVPGGRPSLDSHEAFADSHYHATVRPHHGHPQQNQHYQNQQREAHLPSRYSARCDQSSHGIARDRTRPSLGGVSAASSRDPMRNARSRKPRLVRRADLEARAAQALADPITEYSELLRRRESSAVAEAAAVFGDAPGSGLAPVGDPCVLAGTPTVSYTPRDTPRLGGVPAAAGRPALLPALVPALPPVGEGSAVDLAARRASVSGSRDGDEASPQPAASPRGGAAPERLSLGGINAAGPGGADWGTAPPAPDTLVVAVEESGAGGRVASLADLVGEERNENSPPLEGGTVLGNSNHSDQQAVVAKRAERGARRRVPAVVMMGAAGSVTRSFESLSSAAGRRPKRRLAARVAGGGARVDVTQSLPPQSASAAAGFL